MRETLIPEARHLVKIADLDSLESLVRTSEYSVDIAGDFEWIFGALDKRVNIDRQKVLEWGQRYIAWANEFSDRDGFPILGTEWARRMLDLARAAGRPDLAKLTTDTILASYAPLEKEQRWWLHQRRLQEPS